MPLATEDLAAISQHLLRPLHVRVANLTARATVQLVDDSGRMQTLQIGDLQGGPYPGCEHVQPYGFSSVPLAGADTAVVIFPNGDRGHPLVVAVADRRHRPTGGEPGQVTVYNHNGAKVTLTKDGDIIAEAAPGRTVKLGGAAAVDGAIKGTTRDAAEQTFLTALKVYIAAIKPIADPLNAATPAITAAITAFASAVTAAISSLVEIE